MTTAAMDDDRADYDGEAWDRSDDLSERLQKLLLTPFMTHNVESLVKQKLGKTATWVNPIRVGGYNNLFRLRVENSCDIMARLPQPAMVQFPDEKILGEAATATFIALHTSVPIPRVLSYGRSNSDPLVGPFIIIEYIENCGTMSCALKAPTDDPDEVHVLNPDILEDVLASLYEKAAIHLIRLFQPTFPLIGCLSQTGENVFSVTGRPIAQNMSNMLRLANIPEAVLPPKGRTYRTANEWYVALSEMHIAQLVFQHNDLVKSADDCRTKFVARYLFRKLAREGRLSTFGFAEDSWSAQSKNQTSTLSPAPSCSGSFRIWCDDLRPGNILLDKDREVVAFIDWEFAYIAPTQFALDPPWWLLLDIPEMWPDGIDEWVRVYELRLKTWLCAMEQAEKKSDITSEFTLSTYMRESWETGRFWLSYAARKSWAFDTIFWKYLDERFFGKREQGVERQDLWKTRVHLLSETARAAMESFAERKMEESKEKVLIDNWDHEEVQMRMAEVLFND